MGAVLALPEIIAGVVALAATQALVIAAVDTNLKLNHGQPDLPQIEAGGGSGAGGGGRLPGGSYGMELVPYPPVNIESGIPGVPDWVLQLLPDLPSLSDVVYHIANGIWTSYYHTGRAVIQRGLSEEFQRLLYDAAEGARQAVASVVDFTDPVRGIINKIEYLRDFGRSRENQMLLEGRPLNIGRTAERTQQIYDYVKNKIEQTLSTTSDILYDVGQLPVDGYNALSSGVLHFGQWIEMPGPTGETGEYVIPDWVLYVLSELEHDAEKIHVSDYRRQVKNGNQGKKRKASSNGRNRADPPKSAKKRRSGSVVKRASR